MNNEAKLRLLWLSPNSISLKRIDQLKRKNLARPCEAQQADEEQQIELCRSRDSAAAVSGLAKVSLFE